jgi:hypothetical protein
VSTLYGREGRGGGGGAARAELAGRRARGGRCVIAADGARAGFVRRLHGGGEYRTRDGMRYKGEFSQGRMHGRGALTTAGSDAPGGKSEHTGAFEGDRPHGEGHAAFAHSEFVGGWFKGHPHGEGARARPRPRAARAWSPRPVAARGGRGGVQAGRGARALC